MPQKYSVVTSSRLPFEDFFLCLRFLFTWSVPFYPWFVFLFLICVILPWRCFFLFASFFFLPLCMRPLFCCFYSFFILLLCIRCCSCVVLLYCSIFFLCVFWWFCFSVIKRSPHSMLPSWSHSHLVPQKKIVKSMPPVKSTPSLYWCCCCCCCYCHCCCHHQHQHLSLILSLYIITYYIWVVMFPSFIL